VGRGVVYEALQAPLGRRVALKVLPLAAALDPRAIQRFQLEAQVAGWLQHSRIVPVYAVGVVDDVPYFAMQYIEGGSLGTLIAELRGFAGRGPDTTAGDRSGDSPSGLALGLLTGRFNPSSREVVTDRHLAPMVADEDRPTLEAAPSIGDNAYLRTVARLGIQAADALGYAHEQGIIHRDIKPANLLLDRRGDLWVADFGMADVQGDAGLTLTGDLPGTLRYMSPEQASGQRAIVDRRTDIYSLGATLYELLTLQPAVTGPDKAGIIRRISEEEPVPIRRLNRSVPLDLATVVTKALSKDPANRYETAAKLADDLQRFLDSRPIAARPAGLLSRSWRWCRRKPMQAGLAAALVLALVGGFAGITWNWREAVRQKQDAERQKGLLVISQGRAEASEKKALTHAARADAINDFLIEKLLRQAAPENNPAAKKVTLQEVLDRAAAGVGSSFKDQPEVEAAIRLTIGQTYHDLGDYVQSATHYRAALEIHRQKPDETGQGKFKAMNGLGHSLTHLNHLEEAEPLLVDAATETERLLGSTHDLCLTARVYLATLRQRQGRDSDAELLKRRLVDDKRLTRGPKDPSTLSALHNLGNVLAQERKYEEAEQLFRECLSIRREVNGAGHPDTILCSFSLGSMLSELGRVEEAEKLLRESFESSRQVLGAEHPTTLLMMNTLGALLNKAGRLDDAEKLLRLCLEARQRILGKTHSDSVHTAALLQAVAKQRARAAELKSPAAAVARKP
jgi:serine/threonine protein kinase